MINYSSVATASQFWLDKVWFFKYIFIPLMIMIAIYGIIILFTPRDRSILKEVKKK